MLTLSKRIGVNRYIITFIILTTKELMIIWLMILIKTRWNGKGMKIGLKA